MDVILKEILRYLFGWTPGNVYPSLPDFSLDHILFLRTVSWNRLRIEGSMGIHFKWYFTSPTDRTQTQTLKGERERQKERGKKWKKDRKRVRKWKKDWEWRRGAPKGISKAVLRLEAVNISSINFFSSEARLGKKICIFVLSALAKGQGSLSVCNVLFYYFFACNTPWKSPDRGQLGKWTWSWGRTGPNLVQIHRYRGGEPIDNPFRACEQNVWAVVWPHNGTTSMWM